MVKERVCQSVLTVKHIHREPGTVSPAIQGINYLRENAWKDRIILICNQTHCVHSGKKINALNVRPEAIWTLMVFVSVWIQTALPTIRNQDNAWLATQVTKLTKVNVY